MAWGNKIIGEEKPFNFAQLLLERLNDLFKAANEARYNGDAFRWLNALNSIATSISFKIEENEDDPDSVEEHLKIIRNKIKAANNIQNEIFFLDVQQSLDKFEKKLVKLMYKFGLYYPESQTQYWQDTVNEEYS